MTERLKEELRHLGDGAPELRVPDDAWSRGRRARHRDHLLTGLLVASIVVLAGSLIRLTPAERLATDVLAPRPETARVGLPERLYAVPQRLYGLPEGKTAAYAWEDGVGENDLAVGPAVVAYTAGDSAGLPVVVTSDGGYHPLNLPGFSDAAAVNWSEGDAGLALSPDGRLLAFAWWDPIPPADAPMPAGIRIVDLEDGSVRSLTLTGDNGVDVDRLAWSPDGRWLTWSGLRMRSWTPSNSTWEGFEAGRVRVEPAAPLVDERFPRPFDEPRAVAVSDEGRVVLWTSNAVATWDGAREQQAAVRSPGGAFDASVALSAEGRFAMPLDFDDGTQGIGVFAVPDSLPETLRPEASLTTADGADLAPVGWLVADTLLTRTDEQDSGQVSIGVVDAASDPPPSPEEVTIADGGLGSLTVATDLVDPDAPTVDYPEPSWPWSTSDKVLLALGVALVAGLGLAFVVRRRRLP